MRRRSWQSRRASHAGEPWPASYEAVRSRRHLEINARRLRDRKETLEVAGADTHAADDRDRARHAAARIALGVVAVAELARRRLARASFLGRRGHDATACNASLRSARKRADLPILSMLRGVPARPLNEVAKEVAERRHAATQDETSRDIVPEARAAKLLASLAASGRCVGLKIPRPSGLVGSSPTSGIELRASPRNHVKANSGRDNSIIPVSPQGACAPSAVR